jgi:hypothetical protein
MLERPFYEVHRQRELKPGYEAMLVFYSPSGNVVSKEEATEEVIEIVKVNNDGRSKGDYKRAIDKLLEVLVRINRGSKDDEVIKVLEEMATDPDSQYQVGHKVLENYHRGLGYSGILHWGIKMLAKSGRKEAIELLKEFVNRKEYSEWDHPEVESSVEETVSEALTEMAGADPELQLQVGGAGCDTSWTSISIKKWAIQMLAKSGRKEAIKPLKDMLRKLEDELEYMLKDKIRAPVYGPQIREAIEITRKALKDLGDT